MRCSTLLCCWIALSAFEGGLSAQSPNPPAAGANLHARYVILGSSGAGTVAYARAVIDPGFTCPSISGGDQAVAMTTRANPHNFPVVVCEAVIDIGQALALELADGSAALPTVEKNPTKIHVFGDTGCKAKDCPVGFPALPFASLATAAAKSPPDLVLHMGDANYRGTPSHVMFTEPSSTPLQEPHWTYDAGDGVGAEENCGQNPGSIFYSLNAPNSNYADNWASWRDDFFIPGADLLAAAPWIVTRGNHALCSRSGPGWFYFLDQSSNLTGRQLNCPTAQPNSAPLANVTLGQPYAVDLGTLNVIVIDSANACDSFVNSYFQPQFDDQIARLPQLAPAGTTSWMIQHRPLWGVTEYSDTESTKCADPTTTAGSGATNPDYGCINQTLQAALTGELDGELPEGIKLVLSGHMHRFQSVTFPGTTRPPQIVIGNSGVELDTSPPTGAFQAPVDGDAANVLTTRDKVSSKGASYPAFGFLEITLAADGSWTGTLRNDALGSGLELATCGDPYLADSVCELAPGVTAD